MPNNAFNILHLLKNSDHLNKNAMDCLVLLSLIVDEKGQNTDLHNILSVIKSADNRLVGEPAFISLEKIAEVTDYNR